MHISLKRWTFSELLSHFYCSLNSLVRNMCTHSMRIVQLDVNFSKRYSLAGSVLLNSLALRVSHYSCGRSLLHSVDFDFIRLHTTRKVFFSIWRGRASACDCARRRSMWVWARDTDRILWKRQTHRAFVVFCRIARQNFIELCSVEFRPSQVKVMRNYTTHTVARNSKKENVCVRARDNKDLFRINGIRTRFIDTKKFFWRLSIFFWSNFRTLIVSPKKINCGSASLWFRGE